MQYRQWYEKDIKTSLLGVGAMRFKTVNGEIDEEKANQIIDYAIERGVNYFDTAMPYTEGKNEAFVGKSLKRYNRESFYLATKLTLGYLKTKEEVLEAIDKQLETLQTDYIDFYLLHALNKDKLKLMKEWNVLDIVMDWKKQGKIRNIGFSFHDDYETFKEILELYPWDFCQIQLNYIDTDIQQGIKGYYDLVEKKIPVIIMEPIKGGKLASFNKDVSKYFTQYNKDASIASWALRWVGSLEGVKVILSGMNEMDQVIDNVGTFENFTPLNEQETSIVELVSKKLREIIEVDCTKCRYCMPCTVGLNIPGNFAIFNDYAMYQNEGDSKWRYNLYKKSNEEASLCIECGKCVAECPQQIDIPNELKRMLEVMKFLE